MRFDNWRRGERANFNENYTHLYRIREEGGSGRPPPPPVHLRTDDVRWTYYTSLNLEIPI